MVHTANFYLEITLEDKHYLERRHKENITLLGTKLTDDPKFEGIKTNFYNKNGCQRMYTFIDFIKLLGRADISAKDLPLIQNKINAYLYHIYGNTSKELILLRLDYRFDVIIKSKGERELLLFLYKKAADNYRFKKKYDQYDNSIYFSSKSISSICYDKEVERAAKFEDIEEYEKDVLRFEVSIKRKHLNYRKRKYGIQQKLENYFSTEFQNKYMKENLLPILYSGNYYKIDRADQIITTSNLKEIDKAFLREFLIDISRLGVTGARKILKENNKLKYTPYKYRKALKILAGLGINPILIPKNYKGAPPYLKNPLQL